MDIDTQVDEQLRSLLEAVEAASPVDAVQVLARHLSVTVGATDVTFLIADFSGNSLIRFVSISDCVVIDQVERVTDSLVTVPITGSKHEEALRSQQVVAEPTDGGTRLYAPVTGQGDALGVLELTVPAAPSANVIALVAAGAHALAYVVIATRRYTDLFELGQRNREFSLAAEIQRRLLPPAFTCEGTEFTVAGWLEPAHDIGGDTFDYCVERGGLFASISDAMGHTVQASQLATLAVGSLRNRRRSGGTLAEQADAANEALHTYANEEQFVSALLVHIDLTTGLMTAVNAGHHMPFLVREGKATPIHLDVDIALGMVTDTVYREQTFQLEQGDRLLLVTDGMLERNADELDVATALTEMSELHPREVVHNFARAVLEATGGNLQDDATVLCVDWYGPRADGGDRVSSAGASQAIVTAASARRFT